MREPFRLNFAEIARLTDRQIWDFYLLPELKRQEKENARSRPDKPWRDDAPSTQPTFSPDDSVPDKPIYDDVSEAEVTDEKGNLINPEGVLDMLVEAGLVLRENAEAEKQKRREWLAKQRGNA